MVVDFFCMYLIWALWVSVRVGCVYKIVVFLWSSDEDMQSLASLMSMKQADIGNLDDFEEENEEDEENKVNQEEKAAKITGENWHKELFISVAEV